MIKAKAPNPNQPNPGRPDAPIGKAGGPQPNRPRRALMPWVILFALVALVWVVADRIQRHGTTQSSL